jgi:hypothetical protein
MNKEQAIRELEEARAAAATVARSNGTKPCCYDGMVPLSPQN